MKAVFVHDHFFSISSNLIYSTGSLTKDIWERYLSFFDNLEIIGREQKNHNKGKLALSSTNNVNFNLIKYYDKPSDFYLKHKKIKTEMEEVIIKCNAAIIRLPSELGFKALQICKKKNIPYLIEVVGSAWDALWNMGSLRSKLLAPYSELRVKRALKDAQFAIYVTDSYLQKCYPTNGVTASISNVLIPDDYDQYTLIKRLSKINDMNTKKIKVGIIGSMEVKYKGQDVLLKAIKDLDGILEIDVFLVGVGDGLWLKEIAKKLNIEQNVHFLYKLKPGQEIFDFLDDLDIYVHPSKQEGLPRVIIEAMSRACPVLGSSVAGIPELLEKNFIHQIGDYKTLSKQLVELANNQDLMKDTAKRNFEFSKKFKKSILANKRNDIFQEFINSI